MIILKLKDKEASFFWDFHPAFKNALK